VFPATAQNLAIAMQSCAIKRYKLLADEDVVEQRIYD
jgi:hypothetical protein